MRELAAKENSEVVAVCAAIEAEIAQLDEADRADFLKDIGLDEPGLNRVIRAGYKLLGLQTLFHRRSEGSPCLDGSRRRYGSAGGWRHSHRLRERLHPRRSHRVRRLREPQGRAGREGKRQAAPGRQRRIQSSTKAMCMHSASTSDLRAARASARAIDDRRRDRATALHLSPRFTSIRSSSVACA